MDAAALDSMIQSASKYDSGYLYYLLGSQLQQDKIVPQSAGDEAELGKSFFEKWKVEFRKIICKKEGVYEQFIQGMVTKKDLPKLVAIAILTGTPVVGGILIPQVAAVYLALLVVQAGIGAYCAGFKEP